MSIFSDYECGALSEVEFRNECARMNAQDRDEQNQRQRMGTWSVDIDKTRGWDWRRFYCSECGKWNTYGTTKFCPKCGSEMMVNKDED